MVDLEVWAMVCDSVPRSSLVFTISQPADAFPLDERSDSAVDAEQSPTDELHAGFDGR